MILKDIYNTLLYYPLVNLLVILYLTLGENMGLAIIAMTIIIKAVLYPLTKPSLEIAKKQREIQPEIEKLKKQFKNKQVFAQKQMELYKQHGINPASGCLPQIFQLFVILALYRVFVNILNNNGVVGPELNTIIYFPRFYIEPGTQLNTTFLWLNLTQPDPYYILPILAAVSQFFMSKFMMGGTKKLEDTAKETPQKEDDFMAAFQKQSMYLMPIITLVVGIKLPSGLVLYWFVSTLLTVLQYIILNRKDKEALRNMFSFNLLPKKINEKQQPQLTK